MSRFFYWVLWFAVAAHSGLSMCKFNYGRPYVASPGSEMNYVSSWAGSAEAYNLGAMMKACASGGALAGTTPVVYSYVIAYTLRRDHSLQDCNVGTPNLCQSGASYMRNATDKAHIMGQMAKYAKGTAADFGTTAPLVWMLEPDYYQYAQPGSQGGNPLTYTEAAAFMNEMIDSVKKYLPNALFSLDISPWTTDQGTTQTYYKAFNLSRFTFMNTSGGQANAVGAAGVAKVSVNNKMTWKEIHDLTGKPIIADCGYGVAGASTGYNADWDNAANLNNRIADGVIAISQANPISNWNSIITSTRPSLSALPSCSQTPILRWPTRSHAGWPQADETCDALGRHIERQLVPQAWKPFFPALLEAR